MRTLGRSWDAQELLQEGGIEVSCDTLREWNIKCSPLIAEELRHRESHWDSWWHMDEVCTTVGGVRHWLFLGRTDAHEHARPLEGRGRAKDRA